MRAFSSVFILATLALTANASIMYQRDSTTGIQTCLADLTAVESSSTITENNFKALTVDNIAGSIEALLKDADGLVETIQKASQSCCNLSINKPDRENSKHLSDEVGEFVKEANNVRDRAVFGGIFKIYEQLFLRVVQRVSPAAETLKRCLAERSDKDKAFKPAFVTDVKGIFDGFLSNFKPSS